MKNLPEDSVEDLLRQAERRPSPSAESEARARAKLHSEWQTVAIAQRRQRSWRRFSLAAACAIAMVAGILLLDLNRPVPQEVASMQHVRGTLFVSAERQALRDVEDRQVLAGQRIQTGDDGHIALAWHHGGSIRVNANSDVEFVDASTLQLHRGSIYFDSMPASLLGARAAGDATSLRVTTRYGDVSHVGTQFMAEIRSDSLVVAVREGRVDVDSRMFDVSVENGQQAEFRERRRPVFLSIKTYGERWRWVTESSPGIVVDGRPIDEFLHWVCRELGYRLHYVSDDIRQQAEIDTMQGSIDLPPAEALQYGLLITGFAWHINEGVLHVGSSD